MSTFSPNKNLQMPANGSFNNDWDQPLNLDLLEIDTCFGGNTSIIVTGVSAGTYALTITQYQPPNINFSGTISANLAYVLPTGVGGVWSIYNNTTGAFSLTSPPSGGGSIVLQQGQRSSIVCDGTNVQLADTAAAAQAQANAEAFATAADTTVLSTAETFTTSAVAAERTTAANASNLSSGTVPNAQLPNIGNMPGVTIASDPGGTPSGSPGQMFFYY